MTYGGFFFNFFLIFLFQSRMNHSSQDQITKQWGRQVKDDEIIRRQYWNSAQRRGNQALRGSRKQLYTDTGQETDG